MLESWDIEMAWKTAKVIPEFNKSKRDNLGTIEKLLWCIFQKK